MGNGGRWGGKGKVDRRERKNGTDSSLSLLEIR